MRQCMTVRSSDLLSPFFRQRVRGHEVTSWWIPRPRVTAPAYLRRRAKACSHVRADSLSNLFRQAPFSYQRLDERESVLTVNGHRDKGGWSLVVGSGSWIGKMILPLDPNGVIGWVDEDGKVQFRHAISSIVREREGANLTTNGIQRT